MELSGPSPGWSGWTSPRSSKADDGSSFAPPRSGTEDDGFSFVIEDVGEFVGCRLGQGPGSQASLVRLLCPGPLGQIFRFLVFCLVFFEIFLS